MPSMASVCSCPFANADVGFTLALSVGLLSMAMISQLFYCILL
jgi:hypothetical protein